jgi:hypothetical protein
LGGELLASQEQAMDDAICRRALAFAQSFEWENARVVSVTSADPAIVARCGDPQHGSYRQVRLSMQWPNAKRLWLIAESAPENRDDTKAFLDNEVELLVVCSATDVIYHSFLNTDLD